MRVYVIFLMTGFLLTAWFAAGYAGDGRHALYTALLSDYVVDGRVNYKALCADTRLERYIQQLAATDPDTLPSKSARLAFWLNVYNAYTLKVICDNYPLGSINELHFGGRIIGHILGKTVWDRELVVVNHKKLTLNEVEHSIIRRKFGEPRIHFALVCAAQSCPPLLNEAFTAENLDEQLDHLGRRFLNDPRKNSFDLERRVARVSKIFDWFEEDFGDSDEEILRFIAQYLPTEIASDIQTHTEAWKIKHRPYDWSLNDVQAQSRGSR